VEGTGLRFSFSNNVAKLRFNGGSDSGHTLPVPDYLFSGGTGGGDLAPEYSLLGLLLLPNLT